MVWQAEGQLVHYRIVINVIYTRLRCKYSEPVGLLFGQKSVLNLDQILSIYLVGR